jgi:hypothetical protein
MEIKEQYELLTNISKMKVIKLTPEEKTKKLVIKRLPKARLVKFTTGYQIWVDDEPIGVDFFIPESPTSEEAWKNALMSLRTEQNFNRSHPSKIDTEISEGRTARIRGRIRRGRKPKQETSDLDLDISNDSNYIF